MSYYLALGKIPHKRHTPFRQQAGSLYHEELMGIEGFTGDKRVFQDATRTFEIHVIKGLPHADGLVIGWLPKEKLIVYADMFNLPTEATGPVPNPPVVGTQVFAANMDRLNLDSERIMSVHSLNPDRLTSRAELLKSLGR